MPSTNIRRTTPLFESKRKKRPRISVKCFKDIGSRAVQQDNYLCSSRDPGMLPARGLLAVLADGMGGMSDGELFSSIAVNEMIRCFDSSDPNEEMCSTLLKSYQAARNTALNTPNYDRGGSTVVAVLIRERQLAFLSVGDSRIYLLRGGSLIQLNREQTLGIRLDESAALGYVPPEEALYNRYRASLTNQLCTSTPLPCDRCIAPITICSGDRILLMSDGVFGTLSENEIARIAQQDSKNNASLMIRSVLAKKKPEQDNCSVIIINID